MDAIGACITAPMATMALQSHLNIKNIKKSYTNDDVALVLNAMVGHAGCKQANTAIAVCVTTMDQCMHDSTFELQHQHPWLPELYDYTSIYSSMFRVLIVSTYYEN